MRSSYFYLKHRKHVLWQGVISSYGNIGNRKRKQPVAKKLQQATGISLSICTDTTVMWRHVYGNCSVLLNNFKKNTKLKAGQAGCCGFVSLEGINYYYLIALVTRTEEGMGMKCLNTRYSDSLCLLLCYERDTAWSSFIAAFSPYYTAIKIATYNS